MRNRKSIFLVVLLCIGLLAWYSLGQAQDVKNKRIGTAAATELLIPVGARDLATGGASVATSTGVDALFWNPAGLGRMEFAAEGVLTTLSYIGDIRVNYGAVGVNFSGFGAVALSIKALDFGQIPLTTVDDPENRSGRTFSPAFITVGISYSKAFTDRISAGGTLKIISEKMVRVAGSGVAADIGVQYHGAAGIKGLNLGFAIKNIGPQVTFDGTGLLRKAISSEGRRPEQYYKSLAASFELPSSVELGISYERQVTEFLTVSAHGAFANNNLGLDDYRVGFEAVYTMGKMKFAARAGTLTSPMGADDEQIFGPTFGFGMVIPTQAMTITVDYAYRSVEYFNNNSMFTLKFGF